MFKIASSKLKFQNFHITLHSNSSFSLSPLISFLNVSSKWIYNTSVGSTHPPFHIHSISILVTEDEILETWWFSFLQPLKIYSIALAVSATGILFAFLMETLWYTIQRTSLRCSNTWASRNFTLPKLPKFSPKWSQWWKFIVNNSLSKCSTDIQAVLF